MTHPEDFKYTDTHEWVRTQENADVVTVGISHYAVRKLTDIVYVELPGVGDPISEPQPFGVIEMVAAVFDLTSPVTGQVVQVNQPLTRRLEALLDLLQHDPYGEGWMIKVKLEDEDELNRLMNAAEYRGLVEKWERGE